MCVNSRQHLFLRQRPHSFVECCSDGFKRAWASGASQYDSKSRRQRDRDRRWAILQAQARSYVLKRLLCYRPRDDVAGATGPDPLWYTGSTPGETAPVDVEKGTDSIKWVDNGMGSGRSPFGVTTNTESGGRHQYHSCLPYTFKMDEYRETEGQHIYQENGLF